MKKRISLLVSTLALVALASFAQAAPGTKFAVQGPDGAQTPTDKFSVSDTGWIGIGDAASAPVGPIHVIGSGSTNVAGGNVFQFTSVGVSGVGVTPVTGQFWAPNFTLMRNIDASVNGGLPRINDALGFFNFGSVIGGTRTNRALIYAYAEKNWTSATDSPAYFQFLLNPGGVTQNREVMKINSTGTMTVNGGVRLWPYTGTAVNAALVPTRPATCNSTVAGTMWFTKAATGGTDALSICAEIGGVFAWKNVTLN